MMQKVEILTAQNSRSQLWTAQAHHGGWVYGRAGSGLPKIQQGWTQQGHSLSLYDSTTPYDQTLAELTWGTQVKSSVKSSVKHSSLLAYIAAEPSISAKALADKLGITSRAVEKQLAQLKEQGKLQRIGPAKGGHWEIIE